MKGIVGFIVVAVLCCAMAFAYAEVTQQDKTPHFGKEASEASSWVTDNTTSSSLVVPSVDYDYVWEAEGGDPIITIVNREYKNNEYRPPKRVEIDVHYLDNVYVKDGKVVVELKEKK